MEVVLQCENYVQAEALIACGAADPRIAYSVDIVL